MEKAWTLLLRAQAANPGDLPVITALGYLAQLRGNSSEAMSFYERALKLDALDLKAANNLAILLAKAGRLQEAVPGS